MMAKNFFNEKNLLSFEKKLNSLTKRVILLLNYQKSSAFLS